MTDEEIAREHGFLLLAEWYPPAIGLQERILDALAAARADERERIKAEQDELVAIAREASKVCDSSRVWGGMGWTFSPVHPHKYAKLRTMVGDYWTRKQAEADALTGDGK